MQNKATWTFPLVKFSPQISETQDRWEKVFPTLHFKIEHDLMQAWISHIHQASPMEQEDFRPSPPLWAIGEHAFL